MNTNLEAYSIIPIVQERIATIRRRERLIELRRAVDVGLVRLLTVADCKNRVTKFSTSNHIDSCSFFKSIVYIILD